MSYFLRNKPNGFFSQPNVEMALNIEKKSLKPNELFAQSKM